MMCVHPIIEWEYENILRMYACMLVANLLLVDLCTQLYTNMSHGLKHFGLINQSKYN